MFTFDQLRSFVVLAEELHFGRAAERLNMTQPPLSRQIQKLEIELGFQLFERAPRRVELTRAGTVFLGEASKLLNMATASRSMAQRIANGSRGQLRIGITAAGTLGLLGEVLRRIDARTGGIDVDVSEMVSRDQIVAVERGALDVAFVRTEPSSSELVSLTVTKEPLLAAISRHHHLAVTSRPLNVSEMQGEKLLRYHPREAEYFHTLVKQVLTGVATQESQQLTQIHSMIALVAANQGIALVPESAGTLGMPGVVYRRLSGGDVGTVRVESRAVWRRDISNPAFAVAHAVLAELHGELVPNGDEPE